MGRKRTGKCVHSISKGQTRDLCWAMRSGGRCGSLEPEAGNRWHWRCVFRITATGSSTGLGGRSAAGTRSTEPERFCGTDVNVLVRGP